MLFWIKDGFSSQEQISWKRTSLETLLISSEYLRRIDEYVWFFISVGAVVNIKTPKNDGQGKVYSLRPIKSRQDFTSCYSNVF